VKQEQLFPGATPAPLSRQEAEGDDQARRIAVSDFSRPLLFEAGAGTGKTATLVGRIVAWAMGPGWDEVEAKTEERTHERIAPLVLEGVSAITFTEAAAAEMSTRVGQVLQDLEHAADDHVPIGLERGCLPGAQADWSPRARALRSALDRLTTCTIHAFCRRLLAAHPFELGLDPYFELDARQTRVPLCVREVLEEFFSERWGRREESDLLELARRGFGPPEIEMAVLDLLKEGARAVDFMTSPLNAEVYAELNAKLVPSLTLLGRLAVPFAGVPSNQKTHLVLNAVNDSLALVAAETKQNKSGEKTRFANRQRRLAELFNRKTLDKLKLWRKGELTKNELKRVEGQEAQLAQAAERLEAALLPFLELDPEHLERVRALVAEILARVEARLRQRGLVTFSDLLRDAQRLLNESPEVAATERKRIRQLLVDEFQDTDESQCDIVRQLALRGPESERPTLFCVGDPKQSIYSWRNADLQAYDTFKRELGQAGGEVLHLTRNFRSTPAILEEVERAVAPVMERVVGVQPEFVPLQAHRSPTYANDRAAIEFWPSWPLDENGAFVTSPRSPVQAGYEAEAQAIATDVARLSAEGTAFRDVALLFRSATSVEVYLRALREHAIPYVVQSDRSYYRRREVIDAGALVRCALDPTDQLALVTLLRSPWVGVPDAALFAMWSVGFPDVAARAFRADEEGFEEIKATIDQAKQALPHVPAGEKLDGWDESARAAMCALAELRTAFESDTVDRWVERIRSLFQPDAIEAARFLGAFRLSNLERFFRDLKNTLEERGDVHSVLASLRTSLGRGVESEVTRPSDSGVDAVRVLTIHGSKGLEFAHIYFAQCNRVSLGDRSKKDFFERRGGKVAYAFLGAKTPNAFAVRQRTTLAEAAERVRLLYVALTRAKERLVLLGAFSADPKGAAWRRVTNFTGLLEHREGIDQALSEVRMSPPDHSVVDPFGCLFRSAIGVAKTPGPAAKAPHETALSSACAQPELPTPTAIAVELRALREQREQARLHQARPFSTAASDGGHDFNPADAGLVENAEEQAGSSRRVARAVGVAVHRVLELSDLTVNRAEEFERRLESLGGMLPCLVHVNDLPGALERARALLVGMRDNGLWDRFFDLQTDVVARELDVLLVPTLELGEATGYVSGNIDLLYRDSASGEWVIADYKSDFVDTEAELEERIAGYRAQGRTYVKALRGALQLPDDPRFELWFLHPGRVVVVPT
jgi:ATP-dependent helicase/nuclease subunit A